MLLFPGFIMLYIQHLINNIFFKYSLSRSATCASHRLPFLDRDGRKGLVRIYLCAVTREIGQGSALFLGQIEGCLLTTFSSRLGDAGSNTGFSFQDGDSPPCKRHYPLHPGFVDVFI